MHTILRLIPFVCFVFVLLSCNGNNPTGSSFPTEAQVEADSFNLINQSRRQQGLSELILDSQVAAVARAHSTDMRDRNFFAHTNPDGVTTSDRLRNAGVSFRISGENLVRTSNIRDPATFANDEFLKDPEHRAILLNDAFTRAGVGVARSGDSYWITQDFIGP